MSIDPQHEAADMNICMHKLQQPCSSGRVGEINRVKQAAIPFTLFEVSLYGIGGVSGMDDSGGNSRSEEGTSITKNSNKGLADISGQSEIMAKLTKVDWRRAEGRAARFWAAWMAAQRCSSAAGDNHLLGENSD